MKNSEILVRARKLIASGEKEFICSAVRAATYSFMYGNRHYLHVWIYSLLDRHASYEGWLVTNHPKIYDKMSEKDFRQGRLQWIDWMIAYWQAKGE